MDRMTSFEMADEISGNFTVPWLLVCGSRDKDFHDADTEDRAFPCLKQLEDVGQRWPHPAFLAHIAIATFAPELVTRVRWSECGRNWRGDCSMEGTMGCAHEWRPLQIATPIWDGKDWRWTKRSQTGLGWSTNCWSEVCWKTFWGIFRRWHKPGITKTLGSLKMSVGYMHLSTVSSQMKYAG